jgi:hypothetical protein
MLQELCLSEVSAVILKLQTFKLSPVIDFVELDDARDCSIEDNEGFSVGSHLPCLLLQLPWSEHLSIRHPRASRLNVGIKEDRSVERTITTVMVKSRKTAVTQK